MGGFVGVFGGWFVAFVLRWWVGCLVAVFDCLLLVRFAFVLVLFCSWCLVGVALFGFSVG